MKRSSIAALLVVGTVSNQGTSIGAGEELRIEP
jgi:hypothetical protein